MEETNTRENLFRTELNRTRAEEADDVSTAQSCRQQAGDHHSPATLLLWTPAEEKQNREGENKDGKVTESNLSFIFVRNADCCE